MELRTTISFIVMIMMLITSNSHAKTDTEKLTKHEIDLVIESVVAALESKYVFPEKAKKITKKLTQNHRRGLYQKISDAVPLADRIQQDMLAVVKDSHLIFEFNPAHVAQLKQEYANMNHSWEINTPSDHMERFNFGFQSLKILEGNVGYLKLDSFSDTEHAAETAVAAMNFLAHTDAIIFDLRQNSGGSWKMVQLISSYLFGPTPVELSGFYWRPEDKQTQNWTLPYVPGKRNPNAEVYILTSAFTHSAAEEFTYNLKHMKRATVVGETTVGGAHPGMFEAISDRFILFVPHGRSTNPITHSNWEEVGVVPNIQVAASEALEVAKYEALKALAAKYPGAKGDLHRWFLISAKAKMNPIVLSQTTLESYAGTYGPRTLLVEDGQIYYQRQGGNKLLLNALDVNLFELAVDNSFRIKVIIEDDVAVALQGLFDNGYTDQYAKSN